MTFLQTLRQHRRVASQIRNLPKAALSPERHQVMRRKILMAAQSMPAAPARSDIQGQRTRRFAFATVTASVILFLGASTVVTAQSARPGDSLFGLDRAIDQVRFALALNAHSKANIAASIAEERQSELENIEQQPAINAAAQTQAQAEANEALDRAIIAVGKVTTNSEKNRTTIQTKAAQKVQHLVDLREQLRAKKAAQEAKRVESSDDPSTAQPGNAETTPASQGTPTPRGSAPQ